jgi:hypothetical protein
MAPPIVESLPAPTARRPFAGSSIFNATRDDVCTIYTPRTGLEWTDNLLDTNEKPFACRCGATFARRDLLRRHERIVHHADTNVNNAPHQISDSHDDGISVRTQHETFPVELRYRTLGNFSTQLGHPPLFLQTPDSSGSSINLYPHPSPRYVNSLYSFVDMMGWIQVSILTGDRDLSNPLANHLSAVSDKVPRHTGKHSHLHFRHITVL